MKWKKFKIKTVTDAEDIIISTLYDIGLEGAQIEDKVPLTALEKEINDFVVEIDSALSVSNALTELEIAY